MLFSTLVVAATGLLPLMQLQPSAAAASTAPKVVRSLTELYHVDGPFLDDRLGYSLCLLQDLDGDGTAEILAGLPNRDPFWSTEGHAWVLSGATGAVLREHAGVNTGDRFGRAVASFPDLNHDGVNEYAVGATWAVDPPNGYGTDHPGTTTIYDGATGGEFMLLAGYVSGECFGGGLVGLNDVTGDGQDDFVVGSRFGGAIDSDPLTATGKVRTFSGITLQAVNEVSGTYPGDFLAGEATIAMGDIDGDGAIDVASGAWGYPYNAAQGQVFIISTAKGTVITSLLGEGHGDHFGWSLAKLPDTDGDGLPDLMVGAPSYGPTDVGRAYVFSSATGALLKQFTGSSAGEHFGYAVASVGDQDGDGVADLAVGAPFYAQEAGRAVLLSGVTGALLLQKVGVTGERFGNTFLQLPDLNTDGKPEIAISAVGWPVGFSHGRMTVFTTH